ncbi:NYN domain-containing protein [Sporosarcina siberiensis]|uniref:NYN domain-containing protein n=1 Tax=Sporosarcina siberiensis TaxID=1365606 RepID=A0ABW4SL20_9BACL
MRKDVLLVDGYNIIGAWEELRQMKEERLANARDRLIERLAEYKAYTGWRVIIVFDAHLIAGIEKKKLKHDLEVVYTRENETADERIEKLVIKMASRSVQVHVATSDLTEQWVIFAHGALRISARELEIEMDDIDKKISQRVKDFQEKRPFSKIALTDEVAEIFEKWRRGIK